jgi:hypothetical protein
VPDQLVDVVGISGHPDLDRHRGSPCLVGFVSREDVADDDAGLSGGGGEAERGHGGVLRVEPEHLLGQGPGGHGEAAGVLDVVGDHHEFLRLVVVDAGRAVQVVDRERLRAAGGRQFGFRHRRRSLNQDHGSQTPPGPPHPTGEGTRGRARHIRSPSCEPMPIRTALQTFDSYS